MPAVILSDSPGTEFKAIIVACFSVADAELYKKLLQKMMVF